MPWERVSSGSRAECKQFSGEMGNKNRSLQRGRRHFEILGRFLGGGEKVLLWGSEFGELDSLHGRFVFLKAWGSAEDGGEDGHWSGGKEGFSFLAFGVFHNAALEEAGGRFVGSLA